MTNSDKMWEGKINELQWLLAHDIASLTKEHRVMLIDLLETNKHTAIPKNGVKAIWHQVLEEA